MYYWLSKVNKMATIKSTKAVPLIDEKCLDEIIEHIVYEDTEMKILWANQAACKSTGKLREDIIGHHCYEIWAESTTICSDCPVKKAMETGKPQQIEKNTPDGKTWLIRGSPIKNQEGSIIGGLEITLDISTQKNSEDALLQSEKKYKSLVKNLNVGIYRNTPGKKGTFIEVNPALIDMFGYKSKEELLKINVADLYQNQDDRKFFNKKISQQGFVRNEELKLKKKDGAQFWGSVTAIAIINEKGQIKYFDGIIDDITRRKLAEEEAQREHKYFQSLFRDSPEAIVFLDQNHRVLDINPAFEKMFHYTINELYRQNIDEFIIPQRVHEEGLEYTKNVLNGAIIKAETIRKRKDGSELNVSIQGAPIIIDGMQTGIFGIYRDITEQKRAEKEKETTLKEMQAILEKEQLFKLKTAHHFFNPIAISIGYMDLAMEKLDGAQRKQIQQAYLAIKRIQNVVENIVQHGEIHE